MNVERMEILQKSLKNIRNKRFNMDNFLVTKKYEETNWCRTSGCIAGLAIALFSDKKPHEIEEEYNSSRDKYFYRNKAKDLLGLNIEQAHNLFYAKDEYLDGNKISEYDLDLITKKQARAAVKNVIKHGKPLWSEIEGMEDALYV